MSTFSERRSDSTVQRVLLLIAMEAEAKPLLEKLQLKKVDRLQAMMPFVPCCMYEGTYSCAPTTATATTAATDAVTCEIAVVTNGKDSRTGVDNVGTTPAALFAALAIQEFKPDLVISAGTAGGFKREGATIGDAFIASKFCHHDRRIPIPGYTEYGHGDHAAFPTPALIQSLGFKTGVCSTANSLDCSSTDALVMQQHCAAVKDMEAAAAAWVAELAGVAFIAVKVVTDIVDCSEKPTQEEFLENLSAASAALQQKIPQVVDFVAGKKLSQL